jgi:sensor c-di-GMP phosphodiesterase-like protein
MQIKHLYQPVYNLSNENIAGHEAMLWGPNNEGPADVLAGAEKFGKPDDLGII